ncbi:RNA-directed DNA polymerase [Trichodesmium erythraeum]|uniref:RNA-directed DNA polymerase n=1 Tax=Trichodesmium erythraeum TaxID=1206 RepID=UPI00351ABB85
MFKLPAQLRDKTYSPGAYKTFRIYDPKPPLISAAPYRDRVVHHPLCNIIVPLVEHYFIHHTYANRIDYSSHRALQRFINFSRSSKYILQCDIQKYFPSIDLEILKTKNRPKTKYQNTLWLIDTIIDGSNPQEPVLEYFPGDNPTTPVLRRKGLPIGNLTSQFLANFFLDSLDHFVKEKLQIKKYLRYVDDFALFSDHRETLTQARQKIEQNLTALRLKIHPIKTQIFETRHGANFVGFRVFPERIRVRNDNLRRGRKRLKQMQKDYQNGTLSLEKLKERMQSWEAHLSHGDTYKLRQSIFASYGFSRSQG